MSWFLLKKLKRSKIIKKSKTPKLAIIGKYMYPLDTRMSQEIRILAKNDFEIDVYCFSNGNSSDVENYDRIHIHS